jgi:hypothetical protein
MLGRVNHQMRTICKGSARNVPRGSNNRRHVASGENAAAAPRLDSRVGPTRGPGGSLSRRWPRGSSGPKAP